MFEETTTIGEGETSTQDTTVQPTNDVTVPTPEGEASVVETNAAAPAEASTEPLNEFQLTYDFDDFEADIDSKLSAAEQDEKAPEFYRHSLKEYKKYANQFREDNAPFKEIRGVVPDEDLPTALELIKELHTVSVRDGRPMANTGRVSELLVEKYGGIVPELIKELGKQQAPGSKYNYFATALQQQYGIEPNQLEAIKSYLESNTIPQVPEGYEQAYRALTPKLKEDLPYMDAEAQLELLQNTKAELDRQDGYKQELTERQKRDSIAIDTATEKSYNDRTNSVMTALVTTLGSAQFSSDPKVNALIAQQNAHMAYNAIDPFSPGYGMAKATLNELGVNIDEARVNNILDRMAENCRLSEHYRYHNNQSETKKYESMIARNEQELLAQVNKVAAGLIKARSQGVSAQVTDQEAAISQTDGRAVINGSGAGVGSKAWTGNLAPAQTEERYQQIADLAVSSLAAKN